MMRFCFISLLVLFAITRAYAAGPEVSISIDKQSALLGDSFTLTVTVRGTDDPSPPELPEIPFFDVRYRGIRQESFSSFTVIIQGRRVEQNQTGGGFHFDYDLIPSEAGAFTIPSIPVTVDGKTFRTNPFQVEVFDRTEQSQDIFVKVDVDKNETFLGEKILLTVSWYFNKDIHQYHLSIPWLGGMPNFLVSDPKLDESRRYQRFIVNGDEQVIAQKTTEFYRGQQYAVIRFQKILTPLALGTYTLEPAFLKCDVVKGYTRSPPQSFFDDFFSSDFDSFFDFGGFRQAVTEPFSTRSEPVAITVRDVPGVNRPADYAGAVGQFDFVVSAKPSRLKVGDPLTLTMKVAGSGNVEQLELPPFPEMADFKSYEPESRSNVSEQNGTMVGEKIFERVLVPRREGHYEIPALSFSYFDPERQTYRTLTQGPFPVDVEKGAVEESEVEVVAVTPAGKMEKPKKEIEILKQDIRYIKTALGPLVVRENTGRLPVWLWVFFFAPPPCILLGLFLWQKERERFLSDVGFRRNKKAFQNAKTYLDRAGKAIHDSSARTFYDSLSRSLSQYLADKLNRPVAGVTADFMHQLGRERLDERAEKNLGELLSRSELALFSSVNLDAEQRKNDLKTARDIMDQFEKVLK